MINGIIIGIKGYLQSFGLISELKLWKYFAIPILISIVTAISIGFTAYSLSDNIGALISKLWIWDLGKERFSTIGNVLGGLVIVVLGLLLYRHIVMALSAPFMSPVSEKIEAHLSNEKVHEFRNTSFNQQLWRGIRINLRNLLKELLITIPILLLGLIPVIGFSAAVLLFVVQAYYAGFGNMDYTIERHLTYKESISFVKKHRGLAIGNGIVFMLLLLIPIIGVILVLPSSVVSATKVTIKELHKNLTE